MKKVMVTGVYGLIAGKLYERLARLPERYEAWGLARRRHPSVRVPDGWSPDIPEARFVQSDLSDLDELVEGFQGMDAVVHLAAEPSGKAGWERILASNIIGAHNVFEAARIAGVKRVIFGSSITVSAGWSRFEPYLALREGRFENLPEPLPPVTHEMVNRPVGDYPCSKVYGEALAHSYAHQHDMSCLVVRIGWVTAGDAPPTRAGQSWWCSHRDIVQLFERCVNAPDDLRFDIFYGTSDNRWGWVDIQHAKDVLGYAPLDQGEDHEPDPTALKN